MATLKTTLHETSMRNSPSLCKSIVAIDASQLYPKTLCQVRPPEIGIYIRYEPAKKCKETFANRIGDEFLYIWSCLIFSEPDSSEI